MCAFLFDNAFLSPWKNRIEKYFRPQALPFAKFLQTHSRQTFISMFVKLYNHFIF